MSVNSGTIVTGYSNNTRFYLNWQIASQSIEENITVIKWQLGVKASSTAHWYSNAIKVYNVNINGNTVSSGGTWSNIHLVSSNGYTTQLLSGQTTIPHNSDGTYTFNANFSAWLYDNFSTSASENFELPTIARASQPSCITYPDTTTNIGNIGNSIYIHMNRKSISFTHTVRYGFGSLTGTIATGVRDNCSWTIPTTFYTQIPNSNSGNGTIYVDTYNGSTLIGTKGVGFTCTVSNSNPTVGAIAYSDTNSTITTITQNDQMIVRNQSTLVFTVPTAEAKNSAKISKYELTFNNITKSITGESGGTLNFGPINLSSDSTATLVVTDSRGNTVTTSKEVTIYDWILPHAIISLARKSNYYTETYLKVDGTFSSVGNKNSITIKYQYKKVTDTDYSSLTTIADNTQITLNLDNEFQWNFRVIVSDEFGSTTYNLVLDRGIPIFYFDRIKRSVGVNCFPRGSNMLENSGSYVDNRREFNIPYTIGNGTGWYLALSGSFSHTTNKVYKILVSQLLGGSCGMLYINMRYESSITNIIFRWLFNSGLSSSNFKLKTDGSNFYLYVKTTTAYQQYSIKVIEENELEGWNFNQFTKNAPLYTDIVMEPTGIEPANDIETLYDNSAGTTSTITLNFSAANFKYLEIFYFDNNSKQTKSIKVYNPDGKTFQIDCIEPNDAGTTIYIRTSLWTISGTSVTHNRSAYLKLQTSNPVSVANNQYIKIYRIDGYR